MCEIKKPATAKTSFSIPNLTTLQIDSSGSLTVNSGVTITDDGFVTVNGTLTNNGTFTGDGSELDVLGTMTNAGILSGPFLVVDCTNGAPPCGTFDNAAGGTFNDTGDLDIFGTATNFGTINNIGSHTDVWSGAVFTNESSGAINFDANSGMQLHPTSEVFTNDGSVDLFGGLVGGGFDNSATGTITIEAGALVQFESPDTNDGTINNYATNVFFYSLTGVGSCNDLDSGTGCP